MTFALASITAVPAMVLPEQQAKANQQQPIRFGSKGPKLLRRNDGAQNREAEPAVAILGPSGRPERTLTP